MKDTDFTILFKVLREKHGLSLRNLSREIGLSAPYLCDLENGNRNPNERIVNMLISFYNLNEEEQRILYDAVGKSTDNLPYDVIDYLKNNPDELALIIDKMQDCNFRKTNR